MEKLSVEDLEKIRDRHKVQMSFRAGEHRVRIKVHMGTCGIEAGIRRIRATFVDEIVKRGLADVVVVQAGCVGRCDREPIATIESTGQKPVMYGDLDEDKARRIFEEHVLGGKVVETLALAEEDQTRQG